MPDQAYACIHARMGTGATNACTPGIRDDCGASERQDIKIIRDYCCIRSRAPTHVFQASVMIAVRKMIRSLRRTLPRKRQIRRKMSNIYQKRSRQRDSCIAMFHQRTTRCDRCSADGQLSIAISLIVISDSLIHESRVKTACWHTVQTYEDRTCTQGIRNPQARQRFRPSQC